MLKQTVKELLYDIKEGLGLNVNITHKIIEAHWAVLASYTDEVSKRIESEVVRSWDKRYLPPPAHMAAVAGVGSYGQSNTKQDGFYKSKRDQEDQEYQNMKQVYMSETKEFRNAILNSKPLTDTQTAAKAQVDIYIGYSFGDRDLKKEFDKGKTAFTVCYFAHFREFLAGVLPPITGIPRGNIVLPNNKPKAYDEVYFRGYKPL